MYLEKKKLAQKMGTQHTKLKICLCEKFGLFNNCNVDNNCYLYNLLLCNYQDPKLLKDLYLNLLQFTYPSTKKVLKNYYERTADNWWYNLTWFFLTLTLHATVSKLLQSGLGIITDSNTIWKLLLPRKSNKTKSKNWSLHTLVFLYYQTLTILHVTIVNK